MALLRVNQQIYYEATPILYGTQRFRFQSTTAALVTDWLYKIGPKNADSIRHIVIDFPQLQNTQQPHLHVSWNEVALANTSLEMMALLQSWCPRIETISTAATSTHDMEYSLLFAENKLIREVMELWNALFRGFDRVQNIFVERSKMDDDFDNSDVYRARPIMRELGWTMRTTQCPWEEAQLGAMRRASFTIPAEPGNEQHMPSSQGFAKGWQCDS